MQRILMKKMMRNILTAVVCMYTVTRVCAVDISIPNPGNCGDITTLVCSGDAPTGVWQFRKGGTDDNVIIATNLVIPSPDKYTAVTGTNSVTLSILDTQYSDVDEYSCRIGFTLSSTVTLQYQCKATSARTSHSILPSKKLRIISDKLYPTSPIMSVTLTQPSSTTLPGTVTCAAYPNHYTCVWISSSSLPVGSYTYSLVVTTLSASDAITDTFVIATPGTPTVSNIVTVANRDVVRGRLGQSLTLTCTSTGGYPVQTVAFYRGRVAESNQLASNNTGTLNAGRYTVILAHSFTPARSDDLDTMICTSSYPQADQEQQGLQSKSFQIYLYLRCNTPVVTQTNAATATTSVTMTCEVSACRPAPTITWRYDGSTYTGTSGNPTSEGASETFSRQSEYTRQVTAADNGRTVECIVTYPTDSGLQTQTQTGTINVNFAPTTATITGNRVFNVGNGATLPLTCTTGSSNPASDITWTVNGQTVTSSTDYTTTVGANSGKIRSQVLVLTPTRDMDGHTVTCSASNKVNSQSPASSSVDLDLRYSPIVTVPGQQDYIEGDENKVLTCTAHSNPVAILTWKHAGTSLNTGPQSGNSLTYSLQPTVTRQHYGTYTCTADNGIGSAEVENTLVTVKFAPSLTTTTRSGSGTIVADGSNTLTLTCVSGTSKPVSDISWTINGATTSSTGTLADQAGDYGGVKARRTLELHPTRDNDGDVIRCSAHNSQSTNAVKSNFTLDFLTYRPIINTLSDIAVEVGTPNVVLPCTASSKPASIFKWFQGNTLVAGPSTATIGNNAFSYEIAKLEKHHTGTYICQANNAVGQKDTKPMQLTVQYPPDVNIIAHNVSVTDVSMSLLCNAAGVPAIYTYGSWIQTWSDNQAIKSWPSTTGAWLNHTTLTYEHSGFYTCSASNGKKVYGSTKEFMNSSTYIRVKSFPIIIQPSLNDGDVYKVHASFGGTVTFTVLFYSNTDDVPEINMYKVNNTKKQVIDSTMSTTDVDLPVFDTTIVTTGTTATIALQNVHADDFTDYEVEVKNQIGKRSVRVLIVPQGPPEAPTIVGSSDVAFTSATISWIEGFNGGFTQTYVIQTSTDEITWSNATEIPDIDFETTTNNQSATIDQLNDGTLYYVRMFSYNKEGMSTHYSQTINFTTDAIDETEPPGVPGALIGGAVGGIVVVILVVMVVVLKRRTGSGKKSNNIPMSRNNEDDGDEEIANPLYDTGDANVATYAMPVKPGKEAQGSTPNNDVYAVVDKSQKKDGGKGAQASSSNNDVYAVVDKSKQKKDGGKGAQASAPNNDVYAVVDKSKQKKDKKGKPKMFKGKQKKPANDDVYENAPASALATKKDHVNGGYDANIYEDTDDVPLPVFKKKVNKDGLIYADLEFANQVKDQKRVVIHGIDDMTDYADVDLTKKGQPLPDDYDEQEQ